MPKLLTIYFHLEDFDNYGIRNILLDEEKNISKENIKFYYKNLIGLKEEYIYMFENEIPSNFNMDLLGKCGNPTKIYPVYDLLLNKDKIDNYKLFVENVIKTETSRLSLVYEYSSDFLFEKPEWLKEIEKFYESFKIKEKDISYQGIVLAPVHKFTKESKGFKFLTKKEDIELWNNLLGTYEFPDFMIVRKYNIMNWRFVNKSSEKMLNSLFYWFASAHGCKAHYSFIPANLDYLDALINNFKQIGFTFVEKQELTTVEHVYDENTFEENIYEEEETFAEPSRPEFFPKHEPLRLACAQIEEIMLANSSITDKSTLVLFEDQNIFNNYIYQLLNDLNISFTKDNEYLFYQSNRWFRDKWGIKKDKLELATKSDEIFQIISDFHSFSEKGIEVWLMYREANTFADSIPYKRKIQIAQEFVRLAMSKCKKTKDDRLIKSVDVYDYIIKYCNDFLPNKYFSKTLIPNNLHSMVLNCNIRSVLTVKTRHFVGISLPNSKIPEKTALDELLESVD